MVATMVGSIVVGAVGLGFVYGASGAFWGAILGVIVGGIVINAVLRQLSTTCTRCSRTMKLVTFEQGPSYGPDDSSDERSWYSCTVCGHEEPARWV